ncbi:hypothetical protein M422DRAFT_262786 [Sphaerobolus stellatus SS14]|uniref:Uncharacterized protein n=1 Tax=Sphaerobolus stellatus (strain SS14) TaxID=990650 RepID=A0A0C9V0A9_SPHS4|nr:hypothetical protein M422DRAFT_262786 [Sphaerobolus stellatus SS14]
MELIHLTSDGEEESSHAGVPELMEILTNSDPEEHDSDVSGLDEEPEIMKEAVSVHVNSWKNY